MQFQNKALYNLLRSNWIGDPSIKVEPWQVENYRELGLKDLWSRLKALGINLDEGSYKMYAETCETPEELVDCLWLKEDDLEGHDQSYLLLFELWRRILPHKQSLSIFCDELDHRIDLYDSSPETADELIQEALVELESILDQTADQGQDPKEVFRMLAPYCAHDLECFLYDYIVDQINAGNELYASELIDGFYDYIQDPKWFDFLRARLFASTDVFEANNMLRRLLEQLQEEPDFELLLEISSFLVTAGDAALFVLAVKQAVPLVKTEGDLQDLLSIISEYYRLLDKEQEEQIVNEILSKRSHYDINRPVDPNDKDILRIFSLLKDADWSEV